MAWHGSFMGHIKNFGAVNPWSHYLAIKVHSSSAEISGGRHFLIKIPLLTKKQTGNDLYLSRQKLFQAEAEFHFNYTALGKVVTLTLSRDLDLGNLILKSNEWTLTCHLSLSACQTGLMKELL